MTGTGNPVPVIRVVLLADVEIVQDEVEVEARCEHGHQTRSSLDLLPQGKDLNIETSDPGGREQFTLDKAVDMQAVASLQVTTDVLCSQCVTFSEDGSIEAFGSSVESRRHTLEPILLGVTLWQNAFEADQHILEQTAVLCIAAVSCEKASIVANRLFCRLISLAIAVIVDAITAFLG